MLELDQKTRNSRADHGAGRWYIATTSKWVRVINRITNHTRFTTLYRYTVMKKKYLSILFYFSDVFF